MKGASLTSSFNCLCVSISWSWTCFSWFREKSVGNETEIRSVIYCLIFHICSVSLQRFYAGSFQKTYSLSVSVSLTRSGLQRIIPSVIRRAIRKKDSLADRLVRLDLWRFGLAQIVELAPRVSRATFSSIATPTKDRESVRTRHDEIIIREVEESLSSKRPYYTFNTLYGMGT